LTEEKNEISLKALPAKVSRRVRFTHHWRTGRPPDASLMPFLGTLGSHSKPRLVLLRLNLKVFRPPELVKGDSRISTESPH